MQSPCLAVFTFSTVSAVASIHLYSGCFLPAHQRADSFRLWYWPANESEADLHAFLNDRHHWGFEPLGSKWRPFPNLRPSAFEVSWSPNATAPCAPARAARVPSDAAPAALGHLVALPAPPRRPPRPPGDGLLVTVEVPRTIARAVALRLDGPANDDAVVSEFEIWAVPAAPVAPPRRPAAACPAPPPADPDFSYDDLLAAAAGAGADEASLLAALTDGHWSAPTPPPPAPVCRATRGGAAAAAAAAAAARRSRGCRANRTWVAAALPAPRFEAGAACRALGGGAGTSLLLVGDSRTRQMFLSLWALFHPGRPWADAAPADAGGGKAVGAAAAVAAAAAAAAAATGEAAGAAGAAVSAEAVAAAVAAAGEVEDAEEAFLTAELKDVAVPPALRAACGGNRRYANPDACGGRLTKAAAACGGAVDLAFVEAWLPSAAPAVARALAARLSRPAAPGRPVVVYDGVGAHAVDHGRGLAHGLQAYLAPLADVLRAHRAARRRRTAGGGGGGGGGVAAWRAARAAGRVVFVKGLLEPFSAAHEDNAEPNRHIAAMNAHTRALLQGGSGSERWGGMLVMDTWRLAGARALDCTQWGQGVHYGAGLHLLKNEVFLALAAFASSRSYLGDSDVERGEAALDANGGGAAAARCTAHGGPECSSRAREQEEEEMEELVEE
jgi:hypothetical protein